MNEHLEIVYYDDGGEWEPVWLWRETRRFAWIVRTTLGEPVKVPRGSVRAHEEEP